MKFTVMTACAIRRERFFARRSSRLNINTVKALETKTAALMRRNKMDCFVVE